MVNLTWLVSVLMKQGDLGDVYAERSGGQIGEEAEIGKQKCVGWIEKFNSFSGPFGWKGDTAIAFVEAQHYLGR